MKTFTTITDVEQALKRTHQFLYCYIEGDKYKVWYNGWGYSHIGPDGLVNSHHLNHEFSNHENYKLE